MQKRNRTILIVLLVLLVACFFMPRPVVFFPKHTILNSIEVSTEEGEWKVYGIDRRDEAAEMMEILHHTYEVRSITPYGLPRTWEDCEIEISVQCPANPFTGESKTKFISLGEISASSYNSSIWKSVVFNTDELKAFVLALKDADSAAFDQAEQ